VIIKESIISYQIMSELAIKLIEKEKQEKTGELDLGKCGLKTIPCCVPEALPLLCVLSFNKSCNI